MINSRFIKITCILNLMVLFLGCKKEEAIHVLKAPNGLSATKISSSEIKLEWADNSDNETGFQIERKTVGGEYSVIATTNENITTYRDKSVVENNEYAYRIFSYNVTGRSISSSNGASINTYVDTIPYAETLYANSILGKTATLNSIVNPNSLNAIIIFQYGETEGYGNFRLIQLNNVTVRRDLPISCMINELKGKTTYHYRVTAENSIGRAFGEDKTFTTIGDLPIAYTKEASITDSSITFNARVFPNYLTTRVVFEFGTDTNYGTFVNGGIVNYDQDTTSISPTLNALTPNTTYHYRLMTENELGVKYTEDKIVTTRN